jgi:hypothetical protein
MKTDPFDTFLAEQAVKHPGRDVYDEIVGAICNAYHDYWKPAKTSVEPSHIKLTEVHRHDAVNYTISGTVLWDGVEYGFILNDGNWNGTDMQKWGLAEDVEPYVPEPPTIYTMVPTTDNLFYAGNLGYVKFGQLYLKWRTEEWFMDLVRGYNYDRHFSPGIVTETHFKEKAAKKGLKFVMEDTFIDQMKRYDDLHKIVGQMTQPERIEYFNQQDAVFEAVRTLAMQ